MPKTQKKAVAMDLWMKTLRDPRSKKVIERLESSDNPNARCCLGHLCHALGISRSVDPVSVRYAGQGSILPPSVAKIVNMTQEGNFRTPVDVKGHRVNSLIELNDETNLSPKAIADFIERQMDRNNFMSFKKSVRLA